MLDLLKKIITWVLVVLIIILLMVLLSKWIHRNDAKEKVQNVVDSGVRTIEETKDTVVDGVNNLVDNNTTSSSETTSKETKEENTQVVEVVDTATTTNGSILLGLITLGASTYYIYKHSLEKDS